MKKIILLLIIISLLSACSLFEPTPPEELEEDELPTVEEILGEEEPETLGELVEAEENKTEEEPEEDTEVEKPEETRIDITTDNVTETARAEGKYEGQTVYKTFSFIDIDAMIFDLASLLDVTLDDIRLILYIDGQPFIKPSQSDAAVQHFAEIQEKETNFDNIPIIFTKDEGLIRAIGCDLNQSIIRIVYYNNGSTEIPFFQQVTPKIKNALVTYFNKKMAYPLYCKDDAVVIAPNGTVDCIKAAVTFVRTPKTNIFDEETSYNNDSQDQLVLSRPGFKEEVNFLCKEDMEPIEISFPETNQTTNSTD